MYIIYTSKSMKILIYEHRHKKNITLKQLERLTGYSKSALNDWENEKVSTTLLELKAIAQALGVRITDLFDDDYK